MERNYYGEKFDEIKEEILDEIHELIPEGSVHYFRDTFYVHYIEGEVATTEVCAAVEINQNEMIIFHVCSIGDETTEMVDGFNVLKYDPSSFLDILDHLKKDIREKKLQHLRELVKRTGGKINFDGSFGFHSIVDGDHVAGKKSFLTRIEIDRTYENRVYLGCIFLGEIVEEQEENIPFEQLDSLIAYVESQTKKKFTFRVSGSFSRTFVIEATNEEEAEKLAKAEWLANPLCSDDSNGENWDCCQHNAN